MLLQFKPGGNNNKNHLECFRDSKKWKFPLEKIDVREKVQCFMIY